MQDEAHMLKNANSARSKKLKVVARNCQRRLILTGTPLQNDLSELSNLLAFVMPSLFAQGDDPLQDLEVARPRPLPFASTALPHSQPSNIRDY